LLMSQHAYADDIVILAPSWKFTGLQCPFSVLEKYSVSIDLTCKTVFMVLSPKRRSKVIANVFPQLRFGNNLLHFVKEFKYLGRIFIICPIAIAYSMGQIIKPVCVYACLCALSRSHFLIDFHQNFT